MRRWGLFFFILFILVSLSAACWIIFTQFRARRSGLPPPSWRSYIPFLKSRGNSSSAFANLPTPRSRGPLEWIKDKVTSLRQGQNRTAPGHYEESGAAYGGAGVGLSAYGGGGGGSAAAAAGSRRAPGMDPDEAWDSRVGNEADTYGASGPGGYYEEQELGLAPTTRVIDPYGSNHGNELPAYGEGIDAEGRSKSRDPPTVIGGTQTSDTRYERELGGGGSQQQQQSRALADANNPFSDAHEAGSLRGVSPRPVLDSSLAPAQAGKTKGGDGGGAGQDDSPTERRSMFREGL